MALLDSSYCEVMKQRFLQHWEMGSIQRQEEAACFM
jgi:hypothetical protein